MSTIQLNIAGQHLELTPLEAEDTIREIGRQMSHSATGRGSMATRQLKAGDQRMPGQSSDQRFATGTPGSAPQLTDC